MTESTKVLLNKAEMKWLKKRMKQPRMKTDVVFPGGMVDAGYLTGFCYGDKDHDPVAKELYERGNKAQRDALPKALPMTVSAEKKASWDKFVANNSDDSYSYCVVIATTLVGKALDEGKTPEEAMNKNPELDKLGITGFMAGCVAMSIKNFHARGEEFVRWFNIKNQLQDEGERANEKGTVLNPAIIVLGDKKAS